MYRTISCCKGVVRYCNRFPIAFGRNDSIFWRFGIVVGPSLLKAETADEAKDVTDVLDSGSPEKRQRTSE